MKLNLYNTLSGAKEEFKPIKAGVVGMYHCGPTVYNFAHIGNLRSYVFADTLRRTRGKANDLGRTSRCRRKIHKRVY